MLPTQTFQVAFQFISHVAGGTVRWGGWRRGAGGGWASTSGRCGSASRSSNPDGVLATPLVTRTFAQAAGLQAVAGADVRRATRSAWSSVPRTNSHRSPAAVAARSSYHARRASLGACVDAVDLADRRSPPSSCPWSGRPEGLTAAVVLGRRRHDHRGWLDLAETSARSRASSTRNDGGCARPCNWVMLATTIRPKKPTVVPVSVGRRPASPSSWPLLVAARRAEAAAAGTASSSSPSLAGGGRPAAVR